MGYRGEALEADLQRFYAVDLADLWRGNLRPRKAAVLATQLPPEASIYRQGDDDRLWSLEVQFLASILDQLKYSNAVWTGQKKPPQPIPRPGDAAREADRMAAVESKSKRWEERKRRRQERRRALQ